MSCQLITWKISNLSSLRFFEEKSAEKPGDDPGTRKNWTAQKGSGEIGLKGGLFPKGLEKGWKKRPEIPLEARSPAG